MGRSWILFYYFFYRKQENIYSTIQVIQIRYIDSQYPIYFFKDISYAKAQSEHVRVGFYEKREKEEKIGSKGKGQSFIDQMKESKDPVPLISES